MEPIKSWDIQRETPSAPPPPPRSRVRASSSKPIATRVSKTPRSDKPLKARRKTQRRMVQTALACALVALIALAFYLVWLPALRVTQVYASGPHADDARAIAARDLEGTYAYLVPKNSIFFLPTKIIRNEVLAAYPDISAFSIEAKSLDAVNLISTERVSAFRWCGTAPVASSSPSTCYEADIEGLVFAPADGADIAPNVLLVYAPVDQDASANGYPLRSHVVHASVIPNVLRMEKALLQLNVSIASVVLRSDEADFYTPSGTRITYVLGREEDAITRAAAAFPTLNVNDGSLNYIDLRFDGKVYVKKKG